MVLNIFVDFTLAFCVACCWGILFGTPFKALWMAGLLGGFGHSIRFILLQVGVGLIPATLVASVLVGLTGIFSAHKVHNPPVVLTMPACITMYGGDAARKTNLVEFGFRLPSAKDNRPLKFDEFQELIGQTIFVSATPADFELEKSEGIIIDQLIRPTGLLDPVIDVRPSLNQIDDLLEEITLCTERNERVLVTTLTKRMRKKKRKCRWEMGARLFPVCKAFINSKIWLPY